MAGDELAVVKTVAKQIQDLIIVLNKSDRTTDGERAAAVEFTDRLLKKHLQRPVGPIFQISAAERLAEHPGPERDWDKLVEALQRLVQDSGRAIIHAACERGISRLSEQLLGIINEERDAPERPIEESERRIARMRETIAEAERSMRELGFLLMAEQQHLSSMFVRRHNAFLASVLPLANREFDDMLPTLRTRWFFLPAPPQSRSARDCPAACGILVERRTRRSRKRVPAGGQSFRSNG